MKKELSFAKKNDFVTRYETGDKKTFEKDLTLFAKIFPTSPLLSEFAKANEFNRKNKNGRMLMEMLKVVCSETILENRGIVREKKKNSNEPSNEQKQAKYDEALKELMAENLKELKYQQAKSIAMRLNLDLPDYKKKTIMPALEAFKAELEKGKEKAQDNPKDDEKKSGDPE